MPGVKCGGSRIGADRPTRVKRVAATITSAATILMGQLDGATALPSLRLL
ncbi:MAG: hypothetical protein AAGD09_24690 [Cyanobacteria bacterium P01_F01_bin.56]